MEQAEVDAALAARPAPRVTREQIEASIARVDYHVLPGNAASPGERVTICQITLRNGFDVRGESACVDPRNFDRALGEHYSHEDAFKKLWPLFGFMLAERLHQATMPEVADLDATEQPSPGMMQLYIGTKVLRARPMTRGDYNSLRNWSVPADENPEDQGYLVEYTDGGKPNVAGFEGYVSWSPAEQFEKAYHLVGDGMTFGRAVDAMVRGYRVARAGWNGQGMFAYYVPAAAYPVQTGAAVAHFGEGSLVPYRAYLALKTAQGDVATWSPSASDVLADDWRIID